MLKYKEKWKNKKEIKVNKKEKQIMETKLFIEQPQLHRTNTLKHEEIEIFLYHLGAFLVWAQKRHFF